MIKERASADITIKRPTSNGSTDVVTVPITEKSVRRFMLMQEDFITLAFDLATPVELHIGDYINDEIFGKFVLTREQMPNYDKNTAAYQYNVTFEAEYRRWANYKFMLTEVLDSTRYRKESSWSLTANLNTHATEIINNLNVIGETGYTLSITASKASEVKCVTYNGQDIIASLNLMAEAWECEWWVSSSVIHFGKCEETLEETPLFTLGDNDATANCEEMMMQDNQQTFANRLYVYGSTRNIPSTYDRELVFTVTELEEQTVESTTYHIFRDGDRPMRASYIPTSETTTTDALGTGFSGIYDTEYEGRFYRGYMSTNQSTGIVVASDSSYNIKCRFGLTAKVRFVTGESQCTLSVKVKFTDGTTTTELYSLSRSLSSSEGMGIDYNKVTIDPITFNQTVTLTAGTWKMYVVVEVSDEAYQWNAPELLNNTSTIEYTPYSYSRSCTLTFGDTEYTVRFNPFNQEPGDTYWNYFAFNNDSVPTGFAVNSKYTLSGLSVNVPLSYWSRTDTDDPSAVARIGEKRLHMPLADNNTSKESDDGFDYYKGNGYIELPDLIGAEIVEEAVTLDEVYPKCTLVITNVTATQKREKVENIDGSDEWWDWVQYTIMVKRINGSDFDFDDDYILPDNTLQMKFLTDAEVEDERVSGYPAAENGALLSGMTFDVNFNYGSFILVRNEDYGAKLPNDTLKPKVGDALLLIGWNVNAMESLGLVDQAETALEAKGVEYLQAINDNQYTVTCKMMSDQPFSLIDMFPLDVLESHDATTMQDFYESDEKRFYVKNGYELYTLYKEGTEVKIEHDALKGGEMTSRIIGYEYKLDKPYDTPQYIVGETSAFSRIKQLEKEIKKL